MTQIKSLLALLALLVFLSTSVFAQEEMTSEEWEAEIARLTQEKSDLSAELESLQSSVNSLKDKKNSLQSYEDCQEEMYAMVGASKSDVAAYEA